MDAVRVIVIDDHAVVREGTRQILEQDRGLAVVGEAGTGAEAVQIARQVQPDVVLLDVALPDMSGIDAARQIRAVAPGAKLVMLSAYDDADYVLAAIEVGASAYLLKTVRGREVVETIHAVQRGQVILGAVVADRLRASLSGGPANGVAGLSEREMQILRLAAAGLHNKEIARELQLSVRTVEGHLGHILTKLNVSSRTEAVIYGAAHRWFRVG